ncbi:twin-arginine translocase TatA/TatE family subunit [Salinirussus salinus]|jgi:sec-independent protein translocase protein TatA|uniref:twin-arginine translocase TatA/TatE family subunit n=1 Tax=Salinirussus salinus TaxID=1198300 RepID=UPI001356C2D7|nr:twin-arginine translocase TatA/TatE family subunit [Salinirussus salinus]
MVTTVPLQIPGVPGGPELLIILLIAVLLFGANKIPKLARSSGEAIGEFQKGRQEVEEELQDMKEGGSDSSDEESEDTLDLEEESTSSSGS